MVIPAILGERAQYSAMRLAEVRQRLAGRTSVSALPELAIYCAGSYARLEASTYSDIDLFFMYEEGGPSSSSSRTNEIKLFADVIDVAHNMEFPAFSNDAQYLTTHTCGDMLEHLGSREDDGQNLFTMRMLMLLESKPLHGEQAFRSIQEKIIEAYYRDYPDHQATFEPWFLINDIGRFWKTLLLNYEHKRNQSAVSELQKNKQKVRNFKLKYSRMTTCFATVAALISLRGPVTEEIIYELVQLTPQERLRQIADRRPDVSSAIDEVLTEYAWFLEQTGQTEDELLSGFQDRGHRKERFDRANAYGDAMFDLLTALISGATGAAPNRLLRYLVI